ncbi:MAG: thiamine pyrophosphate-dependent dehydrogenase E1 component subunit alpha [Syntrophales bacterium]|nr:thiamine pyrophosphate-dependent dehydrogenase E1 component subunit alpha [Syntrophales bacterium]
MIAYSRKFLRRLFYEMLRIRLVQLKIESLYHLDEMKTPVHLCIGQEAVAVGVCAALRRDDYISSNHRGHGHYLAKGGDLKALIAELYCRETGCSKGRGGSMHLVDTSCGHMGSSSIVGGGIPIGTGLALASVMKGEDKVSVVFFGDGAADEGVLYESVNFAVLKRLPVIYIYENNEYSVCSHVSQRQWGDVVFHRTPANKMMTCIIDGNDVLAVYEATFKAVRRGRKGLGPSLIECRTYRLRGHAGAGSDEKLGYRTAGEIRKWEKRCPIKRFKAKLLKEKIISRADIEIMEKKISEEIEEAFSFARESPLPREEDLELYLFKE